MKHLWMVCVLAGLPMMATNSAAKKPATKEGDKADAEKPKGAVGKLNVGKPGSSVPGSDSPGEAAPDANKLEATLNAQLLEASHQFQCIFKGDTEVLIPGCDPKAQRLAEAIQNARSQLVAAKVASFKFEISGHTDTHGNPAANKTLSGKRAAVMVKQLTAKGVAAKDLISVGMGGEQPLVKPDNTPAKQAVNCRYEIRVRL